MNKLYVLFVALILLNACSKAEGPQEVLAKVGSYVITKEEFQEAYKNSSVSSQNTLANKQMFLDNMINQKLIILDAQASGLDRNPDFLKMVGNFWQQSLVTAALKQKSKEGVNFEQWVQYLKKNTQIEINQELLK